MGTTRDGFLHHSCYITPTATELKHFEGAIFIQLCLLHWGRLDAPAFKSFCELFHFELRLFFFFMGEGYCGIKVNPCSELPVPLDHVFVFLLLLFLFSSSMKQVLGVSNYCLCCRIQNRMKNAHDRGNQSTWMTPEPGSVNESSTGDAERPVWCYYGVCSLLARKRPIISWSESFQGIVTIVTRNFAPGVDK